MEVKSVVTRGWKKQIMILKSTRYFSIASTLLVYSVFSVAHESSSSNSRHQ